MDVPDKLTLKGKRVLIAQSAERSVNRPSALKTAGAEVIDFPAIIICEPDSWAEFDTITERRDFDFIVFTSANAVNKTAERLVKTNSQIDFTKCKVVAIGKKTAGACKKENISVDIIPQEFSAAGILESVKNYNVQGAVFFIPRSAIARNELVLGLEQQGAKVLTADVYNTKAPSPDIAKPYTDIIATSGFDVAAFTSPSAFSNFVSLMQVSDSAAYFRGKIIAAIGKTTAAAIEETGVKVNILPAEQTMDGLETAIIKYMEHLIG